MTLSLIDQRLLDEQLKEQEGEVLHLYYDSLNIPTIGIGCNLRDIHVPEHIARQITITPVASTELYQMRREVAVLDVARELPWSSGMDPVRRCVLINMAFNMGIGGVVRKNPKMLQCCQLGRYDYAAHEMLDGNWKHQVGDRAYVLAKQMETGLWQFKDAGLRPGGR